MPNRTNQYYVGANITLRGAFEKDGIDQTPDAGSALIEIWKVGTATAILAETAASISGTEINYKYSSLVVGQFAAFFTAEFNSGADKRTGVIEFIVKKKEAH